MTHISASPGGLPDQVREAVRKASPFVVKFARVGYAAKGVIYALVGVLSLMAALGANGGDVTGSRGVMRRLFGQPFGQVLLGLLAAGLACYAVWQFIRAVEDPEHIGDDHRVMTRIGFFISALIHSALVVFAVNLLLGYATRHGAGDDDQGAKSWSATIMSHTAGEWLVAAIGVGIGVYGLKQLTKALKAKLDRIDLSSFSPTTQDWLCRACRFGLAARGVVFGIIGTFFVIAAWHHNPDKARGLGGALDSLREQSYGPWLLGVVALGLIAYGLYEFVKARYRRIVV